MSQSASAMTPGRTNRKFLLLALLLGVIGAVLIYVTFSRSEESSTTTAPVGNTPVVVAKQDIPARTTITQSMVETKLVAEDAAGLGAFSETEAVVGQVTRFEIVTGEQVLSSKVVALSGPAAVSRALSFVVPPGKRAIAVNVEEVVNAGGLVLPGDYVDILVTFNVEFVNPAKPDEREEFENYLTRTLFQNIEVLAVSQGVVDLVPEATPSASGQRARNTEDEPRPEAATVTVLVTPEEAELLFLAELNGKIRFSVRGFGDGDEVPLDYRIHGDLIPRDLPNPFELP